MYRYILELKVNLFLVSEYFILQTNTHQHGLLLTCTRLFFSDRPKLSLKRSSSMQQTFFLGQTHNSSVVTDRSMTWENDFIRGYSTLNMSYCYRQLKLITGWMVEFHSCNHSVGFIGRYIALPIQLAWCNVWYNHVYLVKINGYSIIVSVCCTWM